MTVCEICGKDLPEAKRKRKAKYCSKLCEKVKNRNRYYEKNPTIYPTTVSCGTIGAINELKVTVDLLSRGYSVYRSVSPHAKCDLAVVLGDKFYRVECTTGCYNRNGGKPGWPNKNPENFDILAIVFHDCIRYIPEIG